jgi:hypothetical protein
VGRGRWPAANNGGGTRWAAVSGERKGSRRLEAARWSAPRTRREGKRRGEARGRRGRAAAGGAGGRGGGAGGRGRPTGGPHLSVRGREEGERRRWGGPRGPKQ